MRMTADRSWASIEPRGAARRARESAFALLVGLAAMTIALAGKWVIHEVSGDDVAYLPLFAMLPVAAIAGGFPAGVVLVVGGAVLDAFLFQRPAGTVGIADPSAVLRFVLFIPAGCWLSWLIANLARLRREARSEAQVATELLDALPDVAILLDRDLRIQRANRRLEEMGWDRGTLTGRDASVVIPRIREAMDGAAQAATLELLSADGSEVAVDLVSARVDAPAGGGWFIAARDVRERIDQEIRLVRLASAERRTVRSFQALLASMDAGVAVTGADGEITLINDAMTALTGGPVTTRVALAEALGVTLVPGDAHRTASGRWLRLVVQDDGDAGLVIAVDVTAEREAAAAQEAFIGVLSHELRTPVTTILGISHLLQRPLPRAPDASADLAADLQAEATRLDDLIEDLIVLSRAQSGSVGFEAEPVLLQRAIPMSLEAEAKRYPTVAFRADVATDLPPVSGDATFVDQVLRNLIGNAGKYSTSADNEVIVSAVQRDGSVEVSVLDDGPGFAPEDRDRLFDLYFRSAKTSREREGSGIGLYVARTLVEAMGGRIGASLREPRGAAFVFTLPVIEADDDVGP